MVHLQLKNEKLFERGVSIIRQIAGVDRQLAMTTMESANGNVPVALVMLCAKVSKAEALRRLRRTQGNFRKAIEG
jgi:N-acetylmuramic acid 6-phosphate etherase